MVRRYSYFITFIDSLFNEKRDRRLTKWIQFLSKSNRRNSKVQKDEDLSYKTWTRIDRIRFHECFFKFCRSAWVDIQKLGEFTDKTIIELYHYAKIFLNRCLHYSNDSNKEVIQNILNLLEYPSSIDIERETKLNGGDKSVLIKPLFNDRGYKDMVGEKVDEWCENASEIFNIYILCYGVSEDALKIELSQLITETVDPLTNWWEKDHDVSLLIGTFRHGWGNFPSIREDVNLAFWEYEDIISGVSNYLKHNFDKDNFSVSSTDTNANIEELLPNDLNLKFKIQWAKIKEFNNTRNLDLTNSWPNDNYLNQRIKIILDIILKGNPSIIEEKKKKMLELREEGKKKKSGNIIKKQRKKRAT